MQRLRSLKILILVLTFISLSAMGQAPYKVDLQYQATEIRGVPSAVSNQDIQRQGAQRTVSVLSPQFKNGLQIKTSIVDAKNDYKDYVIQEQSGRERSLGDDFKSSELSGSLRFDYSLKQFLFSVERSQSLSASPFSYNLNSIGLTAQLNQNLTQVYVQHGFGENIIPQSFFTDLKTAERKERQQKIQIRNLTLGASQVLTEKWKSAIEFSFSQKSDRPEAVGLDLRTSYSVSAKDFLRFDLRQIQESKNKTLQDERGYFQLRAAELAYTRYITYDLALSLGYGLVVEQEDNPQVPRKDQIASDVYNLKADYQGQSISAGVSLQSIATNVDYSSLTAGGQVSWSF